MDGFNGGNGRMNLNKGPATQNQMNNQQQYQNNGYFEGQNQQNLGSQPRNFGEQQNFNNQQNFNSQQNFNEPDMGFTPYVNDTTYQNQSYAKSYQKAVKNKTYRNELNTTGAYNLNLMVYVLLATAMFMTGQILALVVLFAVAFIMEKNNKLNQVIVTMILASLALNIIYSAWLLICQPLSSAFSSICNKTDYGSFLYTISYGLVNIISTLRNIVSWLYDLVLIGLGIFTFIKVDRGLFRVPKIVSKYLN